MEYKKGFTLIEVLAVIVVLAILVIFIAPNIVNRLNDAKVNMFRTEIIALMKSAEDEYHMDRALYKLNYSYKTGDLLVNTREEVEYCVILNKDGSVNNITVVDNKKLFKGTGTNDKDITIVNIDKPESVNCQITNDIPTTVVTTANYKETLLHGTDPVLKGDLIPVILTSTDSDWTVTYADVKNEWYKYAESKWANAVRLVAEPSNTSYKAGDVIAHEDISAYFVWIPRYKYKLFDMGNYSSTVSSVTAKNQLIDIVFGTETTIDSLSSCATPMKSGESGNCAVGKYMTHPAFISFNSNGFWVGKFETTGSTSNVTVLPNSTSLKSKKIKEFFETSYNYSRILDSHMMKNTEWGAVAYLTNSSYGRGNTEVWNNSNGKTGCVGSSVNAYSSDTCAYLWYTLNGLNGSTTKNNTGIFDMSTGWWEYMASYIDGKYGSSGFNETSISIYSGKYFDIYKSDSLISSYNNRILGDATGELGPFKYSSSFNYSSWYSDRSHFIESSNSWFERGGQKAHGDNGGIFSFGRDPGYAMGSVSFRLVLTPQ